MTHFEKIGNKAKSSFRAHEQAYRFGPFRFRPGSAELFRGRTRIPLKGQSAKVLGILLERRGNLVSREDLIRRIWPDRTVEFDLSLNSCLRDIRHALGDNPKDPRFIETLAKRGYRFIGQAHVFPDPAPGALHASMLRPGFAAGLVLIGVLAAGVLVGPAIYKDFKATPPAQQEVTEEARTLMLAGVSALYDFEVPKTEEALAYFDQAVQADPGFIEAYTMTARTIFARGQPEDAPKAFAAIDRILELDPYNTEAMAMAGAIKQTLLFDFQGALESYNQVLEMDPNFGRAYMALAGIYMVRGDSGRSLAEVKKALNIDPIRLTNSGQVGWYFYLAGRHKEGLEFCLETLTVNPENAGTYSCFVNHYLALGDQEKAAENALRFLAAAGVPETDLEALENASPHEMLDYMFTVVGTESRPDRFDPSRLNQALALTRQGKTEEALEVLARAFEERNYYLPFVAVIPDFKVLKDSRKFQALVQAMNLDPAP